MVDLSIARKICGGEAVSFYTSTLDELKKNNIRIKKYGRVGSNLIVKYKLPDGIIVDITIHPENKVSVRDYTKKENLTYTEFLKKLKYSLSDSSGKNL